MDDGLPPLRCGACMYYDPTGTAKGVCRRYPAKIEKLPMEWCGEFESEFEPMVRDPIGEAISEDDDDGSP